VQPSSIQSPPESFLILLFRYWRPLNRLLLWDFHFFISRCLPQLFLRAKLITPFLNSECAQAAFSLNCEVPVLSPVHEQEMEIRRARCQVRHVRTCLQCHIRRRTHINEQRKSVKYAAFRSNPRIIREKTTNSTLKRTVESERKNKAWRRSEASTCTNHQLLRAS
jgi:hypothetical protein